ncbi:Crp/Fnr family transcriptional regulator [Yoonia sp. R2331]|uniref:Crp/Fnr family transcriptional regulator n=1 Tax=Yoonia sp. R2331 TaxID=3237238 RepID=UPI0034E48C82
MKATSSAFLLRLERHAELSCDERYVFEQLERDAISRKKRSAVFDPARADARIAIIKSGWAVSRATSAAGQSTITQIYMPGDIVGLADLGFPMPPHDVQMQTDGAVCLIDRRTLSRMGHDHPRLLALLLSMSSLEEVALRDRLHAITRLSAEDRLIHFILSMKSRTAQLTDQPSDRFPLHMSQKDIGDTLGLTDIYVNRLMRKLSSTGQIDVARPYIRITDRAGWAKRVGYKDRYANLDTSWIANAS